MVIYIIYGILFRLIVILAEVPNFRKDSIPVSHFIMPKDYVITIINVIEDLELGLHKLVDQDR